MTQAFSRLQKRIMRKEPDVTELDDIVCEIGHCYPHGAFIATEAPRLWEDPHSPSGAPGSRIPHVPLYAEDRGSLSTLDLVKRSFVLLTADDNSAWVSAAKAAKVPIDAFVINSSSMPFRDREGAFASRTRLDVGQALLVRPDGIIASRLHAKDGDSEQVLSQHLQEILRS